MPKLKEAQTPLQKATQVKKDIPHDPVMTSPTPIAKIIKDKVLNKSEPKETPIKKYNLSGRPSKYKKEYCEQMLKYFDIEPTKVLYITTDGKNEYHKEEPKLFPADLPTFEGFSFSIGVNCDTLVEWATAEITLENGNKKLKHPEFSATYKHCKELQKKILVTNGLSNLYSSNFAIFVATNFTEMRDKKSHEVAGPEGGPIPMANKLTAEQEQAIRDKISEVMMEANK